MSSPSALKSINRTKITRKTMRYGYSCYTNLKMISLQFTASYFVNFIISSSTSSDVKPCWRYGKRYCSTQLRSASSTQNTSVRFVKYRLTLSSHSTRLSAVAHTYRDRNPNQANLYGRREKQVSPQWSSTSATQAKPSMSNAITSASPATASYFSWD